MQNLHFIVSSNPSSFPLPQPASLQSTRTIRRRYVAFLLLCLCALLVVACGPQANREESDDTLVADAQRIALEYQTSGNLEQARTALGQLDVANPNHWMIYATETAIQENADPTTVAAMVKLVDDLGLSSNNITSYATQNNLLPAVVQAVSGNAQSAEAATDEQPAMQSAPAAQPPAENPLGAAENVQITTTLSPDTSAEVITPTAAAISPPQTPATAKATDLLNVRSGPGTEYNLAGAMQNGESAEILGKNTAGDWWQVQLTNGQQGWVFGQLVELTGDASAIAVAANIPAPPPTATPAPVVAAPTTAPVEAPPPAEEAPAEEVPAEAPPPADPNAPPHFTLVSKRLWGKQENDGCVGKHLLRIHVLDANDNRLNGVRLKGIYIGQELVTGDQGKGDGIIEYDLHGSGEGFMVIRDNDGREATSDRGEGFTTQSRDIDQATLINTGYCSNDEDCQIFYDSWGCNGHHSWEAIFKRNY